jgi:hypothetical protein
LRSDQNPFSICRSFGRAKMVCKRGASFGLALTTPALAITPLIQVNHRYPPVDMEQPTKTGTRRDIFRLMGGMSLTIASAAFFPEWPDVPAEDDPVKVVSGAQANSVGASRTATTSEALSLLPVEVEHLNLVLNLEYVGAQFYSFAAGGSMLSSALQMGVGTQGAVVGGRKVPFSDLLVHRYASELANDRSSRLRTLREQLPGGAIAQPSIDFSVSSTSPFSVVARGAGLIPMGAVFDPFRSDCEFLLSAYVMENLVAAAYRGMAGVIGAGPPQAATQNLANAIYHGGLVRAIIAEKAQESPTLPEFCASLGAYIAHLDGSDISNGSLANAGAVSTDLFDADGVAIPFTRSVKQIMSTLYLEHGGERPGGFLPYGTNGLATLA